MVQTQISAVENIPRGETSRDQEKLVKGFSKDYNQSNLPPVYATSLPVGAAIYDSIIKLELVKQF